MAPDCITLRKPSFAAGIQSIFANCSILQDHQVRMYCDTSKTSTRWCQQWHALLLDIGPCKKTYTEHGLVLEQIMPTKCWTSTWHDFKLLFFPHAFLRCLALTYRVGVRMGNGAHGPKKTDEELNFNVMQRRRPHSCLIGFFFPLRASCAAAASAS